MRIFLVASLALGFAEVAAGGPPKPLPISAHNCYIRNSESNKRLVEALDLGIDNIEIDLGWDATGQRLIVGHEASPSPGMLYPEFEKYLVPALEEHWKKPRPDNAPTVLTIDWKTTDPGAVRRFKQFLDAHPDWFSSAPKADPSPMTPRKLTVCFTGEDRAKDLYDELITPGGTYRAFRDSDYGAFGLFRKNVDDYAPKSATSYHRFISMFWGHVWSVDLPYIGEVGIPPGLDTEWTKEKEARLQALVSRAHKQGYMIRFYTLNGNHGDKLERFPSVPAAVLRWQATARAGADWIATDEYQEIVKKLSKP